MANQLACHLKRIICLYSRAGFVIQAILMNMEFDKVIPGILKIVINTNAASEHDAVVERHIRVIKERCWACMAVMPLKK